MIAANVQNIFDALTLSLIAGLPLLLAIFSCTSFKKSVVRFLPLATLPALIAGFTAPVDLVVQVPWFFMSGRMGLDETGHVFLCLSGFIWMLASFSSRTLLKDDPNQTRYLIFFLIAMAGNFGLILARDMLGYYLFFALMSFAAYGLVAHKGSDDAIKAGRLYLILVMIGEVALFTALITLAHDIGSLALEDIGGASYHPLTLACLFIGFGVKIGALPLHGWMMPAYQTTPIPAAAALAGAMVNAGILGWLRFLPLGQASCPQAAQWFIAVGALAAVYGVIIGLTRKQPGAVLGGSSISQMGLITVIFGLGLVDHDAGLHAAPVVILYVVHHSMAKSSLFFGYNLVERQGKIMSRLQMGAILLPALALAGLPFTSGAIAKTAFKDLAVILGEPWYGMSGYFLPVTAMGTTMIMLHFVYLLKRSKGIKKAGKRESRIFAVSCLATAITLWLWPEARNAASNSLAGMKFVQGLWPIAGGCLLFLCWQRITVGKKVIDDAPKKPTALDDILRRIAEAFQEKEWQKPKQNRLTPYLQEEIPRLRKAEKIMGRWKMIGLSYLALCLCLLYLLL